MKVNSTTMHMGQGQPRRNAGRGFTLIELLVVIAIIAILAALLLPALAAAKRKGLQTQCLSNFHQVSIGQTMYAEDFKDWYPIWGGYDAGHPVNFIRAPHYLRYVYWGPSNKRIPDEFVKPTPEEAFNNLGYLYPLKYIGTGRILYCPGFPISSPLSTARYSKPTFLSTDDGGVIRSTILYNPRLVNASGTQPSDQTRAFQKTAQVVRASGRKLFAMDYLEAPGGSKPAMPFTSQYFAHYPYKGWNILFTDGSAGKTYSSDAFILATKNLITEDSTKCRQLYDIVFNNLEANAR
jgi:prepilin-type N-terminal cleavage/methylation domain-containing protein